MERFKHKYRIRVEQRPDEEHQRFYPEISIDKKNMPESWCNTQFPIEHRWYKTQQECEQHIDRLKNGNKDYTVKIINI